ncbi:hypothetical protein OUZ56_018195 [Daphnia magna]|uniref:Uncharacterized protein n=1 Tax=Daphnia magna TaxID=35525 RepID=A0ABQ9Z8C0_9CRUS|nr:hypothetical protein OUZ56_018195 [Daphnia magna]
MTRIFLRLFSIVDFDSTALPTELSKDGILTRATYVHKNLFVKPYALRPLAYRLRLEELHLDGIWLRLKLRANQN